MTKIKNLKAIHNVDQSILDETLLVQYDKDKEFESNSQPDTPTTCRSGHWFSMTKIKNLKAIHNVASRLHVAHELVQYDKDKEFESNSQPTSVWACPTTTGSV